MGLRDIIYKILVETYAILIQFCENSAGHLLKNNHLLIQFC